MGEAPDGETALFCHACHISGNTVSATSSEDECQDRGLVQGPSIGRSICCSEALALLREEREQREREKSVAEAVLEKMLTKAEETAGDKRLLEQVKAARDRYKEAVTRLAAMSETGFIKAFLAERGLDLIE